MSHLSALPTRLTTAMLVRLGAQVVGRQQGGRATADEDRVDRRCTGKGPRRDLEFGQHGIGVALGAPARQVTRRVRVEVAVAAPRGAERDVHVDAEAARADRAQRGVGQRAVGRHRFAVGKWTGHSTSVRHMTLVRVDTDRGVTTLTLDSPHNRNALSTPLMTELLDALATAAADPAVRVVVLSHTGPVFCSGADLKETAAAYASGQVPVGMLGDVLAAVVECPKPVVARIGGPARAGGLGLVAAADIAICATEATFAFTEVRLGVIPAVISSTVLRRLAPRRHRSCT